ncbi:MAG: DNA-directed RNA polymerase subunit RpoH/Rpb5 C-terminal domain-containing protein [Candidatus Nanoarchaeia archaeon]|nr:DNA-directed RNA polymerase subunit RpoH/Rpb5 C-terminal domain-containing protein [Candidatus Nanoarchaeia archaeon]
MAKNPIQLDISKHVLIPKHKLLDEKSSKTLMEQYKISPNQLPSMSVKDPMAKHLNAEIGSIIEIERISEVTGKHKYYRRVV